MSTRQQALKHIIELATLHKVSVREFADLMHANDEQKTTNAATRRLFAYLSGICLFSGISAYINMFWQEMNSFERVIITLGSGICLYIIALVSMHDARYKRAASPMFLMASVLQVVGWFVAIDEWGFVANPVYGSLFVFALMFVQQGITFYKTRNSTLLFFTIAFGALMFATWFDLLDMSDTVIGMVVGLSLVLLTYGMNKIRHSSMSGFWYLCGGLLFLGYSFDFLHHTAVEFLFVGIACLMVYLSVLSHSRMLMTVSVGAMMAYIAYFTIAHFVDSIGWPIALILCGLMFSAISAEAWKLNRKFLPITIPTLFKNYDRPTAMKTLPKNYDHKEREAFWQQHWVDNGTYHFRDDLPREQTFVIDTPPPTVSGILHMGHIFSYTQADFIARYQRMSGRDVFYPMGFDDNGLPTERLVEKTKKVRGSAMPRADFVALCREVVKDAEDEFRRLFKKRGIKCGLEAGIPDYQ
jgi:hypothetical protein